MAKNLQTGDKVAYSVQWLRSIMAQTGDLPRHRGTVIDFIPFGPSKRLVVIKWDAPYTDSPSKVLEANLAKVGVNLEFCAG